MKLEARGYAKKIQNRTSSSGAFVTFDLAVKQKVRRPGGERVDETLYLRCVDWGRSGQEPPAEGEYVGVIGLATITATTKGDRTFVNVDLSVDGYEKLPQRERQSAPTAASVAPPEDPFAI